MRNGCYKCEQRYFKCHSSCEKYKEFRQVLEIENKKKREATLVNEITIEAMFNSRKRRGDFK